MKVVEIRNMCLSYDRKVCNEPADWAGLYIIKQILRNIQIKVLKNAVNETELWVPENIVKTVDQWFHKSSSGNKGSNSKGGNP